MAETGQTGGGSRVSEGGRSPAADLLRRTRTLVATVLAVLSTLALVGDKLRGVAAAPLLAHAYLVGTLFRVEIVVMLVIVVFLPWLLRLARDLRSGGGWLRANWHRLTGRERSAMAGAALVVLISVLISIYQGRFYLAGKRLLLHNYPSWAISRATAAFEKGDFDQAVWSLRACSDVVKSSRCVDAAMALEKRVAMAAELRKLVRDPGRAAIGAEALMYDSYVLDRNRVLYSTTAEELNRRVKDLYIVFRRAVEAAEGGRLEDALSLFQQVNEQSPGFGNSHRLVEELRRELRTGVPGVHIAALRRYAAAAFLEQMVRTREIPRVEDLAEEIDISQASW